MAVSADHLAENHCTTSSSSGMTTHHEFVLELHGWVYHVRGPTDLSRLQAFAYLLPNVVTSNWVATHGRLFPREEPTSVQALEELRQQARGSGMRVCVAFSNLTCTHSR